MNNLHVEKDIEKDSTMFKYKEFITSVFVVAMWQSIFTIIDSYVGERLYINVIMLFVSSLGIYLLTGHVKLN